MLLLYLPHFYSQSLRYFTLRGAAWGSCSLTPASRCWRASVMARSSSLWVCLFAIRSFRRCALRLGVAQLSAAAAVEEDQRDSLSQLARAVPISEGPFAVVADPTPAWIAIPSMLVVTIIVLILAAYRIRHMEIRYGSDYGSDCRRSSR
jgi:hypothetical protein